MTIQRAYLEFPVCMQDTGCASENKRATEEGPYQFINEAVSLEDINMI
jgi:hypothetical protein